MATTMNMFEYFHCMTQFIDELVEKHGYDREILTKTWQTKNAKWMKEAEDVVAEEKPAAKKAGKKACKKDTVGEVEVDTTAPKKAAKGKKAAKETVTPAEVHADDMANDEKAKCTHKFTSGKNSGTTCTKDALEGTDKCKTHTPKDKKDSKKSETESDTEKTEKKAGKKAAKKSEEVAEPAAEEETTAEPEVAAEDTAEPAATATTKCTHLYKTGKDKGTTCTHDALEGTDKCKTHTPKEKTPKTSPSKEE